MKYPEAYEEYWLTTAKRDGMRIGKRSTFKFWQREIADGADEAELLRASKAYTKHCNKADTFAHPKDPERFLSTGIWEDFLDLPEDIEFVMTTPDIAKAYWTEQEKPYMLAKLASNWPPDFCLRVPKQFADEFNERLPTPNCKGG